MVTNRLPLRDPRTVARDLPGILDVLFPRLSGGLVKSLNQKMVRHPDIGPVDEDIIVQSEVQKSMLFEISMVRAENILKGKGETDWDECLLMASTRQKRHYDAKIPNELKQCDMDVATHAGNNLIAMLNSVKSNYPGAELEHSPAIPGLGWIASGNGDFALGPLLIEVKHTERNFISGDFRQILMYWLLKYANVINNDNDIWTDVLLLNPRRNSALTVKFDYLLQSASSNLNRVELFELLRSITGQDSEHR